MDNLKQEIEKAKLELQIAEQNLNNAESEFIDAAIHEYNAKKSRLNALLNLAKGGV